MDRVAGDLQIEQDMAFQRRDWRVQRIGWAVMVLVVAASTAGLLGSGPLSRGRTEVPGVVSVDYQRFSRFQAPEELRVQVAPAATAAPEVRLAVDRRFLDGAEIRSILPRPDRVESAGGDVTFVFPLARPGEGLDVVFNLRSEHLGLARGRVGVVRADGPPATVEFRQVVYP